ncbi:MAG: hypothetical protein VKS61_02180 [Candidatus Sericytochromatia bacterium]|nr:hypothetical protein [Candidatus Sericytochromatia bacterium]
MPLLYPLLAACLLATGLSGPAQARVPGPADEAEVAPSRPSWLPPSVLTVGGAVLAVPLVGLSLVFQGGLGTAPMLVPAPLVLGAGHFYAGDPTRGLLYGLGGYAAMGLPYGLTLAVANALNPPSSSVTASGNNLVQAALVGTLSMLTYGACGAWDANETERRVLRERRVDLTARPGEPPRPAALPGRNAVGASVGALAGTGLTLGRDLGGGFGLRVAGLGSVDEGRTFWNLGGALTRDVLAVPIGSTPVMLYAMLGVDARGVAFAGGSGLSAGAALQVRGTPGLGLTYGPFFLEGGQSAYYDGTLAFEPAFGTGLLWRF